MSRTWIGIDLGGTRIKGCAVAETGNVLLERDTETRDDGTGGWVDRVRDLVADMEKDIGDTASGIGLSAPGLAAPDARSIALMPGRMEGLVGLDWPKTLERPVTVLNDGHAFALGEAWLGAARGCRHAVILTLGTGVGGGVICNGELLLGHRSRAGHLGHLSLDPEGRPDCTGLPGGLEDYIGNASLPQRSNGRFTMTHDLLAAMHDGDAEANVIWLSSVRALAAGIASFINLFDPEKVVLGGGIGLAGDDLLDPLQARLHEIEWVIGGNPVQVVTSTLGTHAGSIGAARQAMNMENT